MLITLGVHHYDNFIELITKASITIASADCTYLRRYFDVYTADINLLSCRAEETERNLIKYLRVSIA